MYDKVKNIVIVILFAVLLFGTFVMCVLNPSDIFSKSERRELSAFPQFSAETVLSGEFASGFEKYATERFPYRDFFRGIKANFNTKVFRKLDNNGLFVAQGHISKIDDKVNPKMMEYAAEKFSFIYNSYLKDSNTNVYFSIIPDKNFLLAKNNGYPSMDYDKFISEMRDKTEYMSYIDVTDLLELDDYYTTDTHWRQENIVDIAERIGDKMGVDVRTSYEQNILKNRFFGVYFGQLAIRFSPDEMVYLTNDTLKNCVVTYYDTGVPKVGEMYNMDKAEGKDPYEMFLSGTTPLVTIENPQAKTERELVVFRDSFGSSLAPLLAEGYKKITLVDIRYMQSAFVGNLVEFEGKDVLFLYSTTLLNNSMAMK